MILLLRRWSGFAFIVSCRCWYSTVVGSLPGHPTLRIPQRTPVSDDDNTSNTINNNTNSNNHTTTGTSDTPVQIPNESIGEDSRSDDNNNHSDEVATKPETYDDAPIHIPDNEWDGKKSQYTAIAKASPCLCQPVAFELAVDLSLTVGQCGPEAPNTDSFEPDKPRAPAVEKKCTTKPYPFSFHQLDFATIQEHDTNGSILKYSNWQGPLKNGESFWYESTILSRMNEEMMERAKGVAGNPNMRRKDQYGQIYVAIVGHNAKGEMGQVWFYVDIIGNCHPDSIITKDEQMGPTRVTSLKFPPETECSQENLY